MYTHSFSFNTDICLHIHSAECTVRLLNQAGRNNYPYNPKICGKHRESKYVFADPYAKNTNSLYQI